MWLEGRRQPPSERSESSNVMQGVPAPMLIDVSNHALSLRWWGSPGKLVALEQILESYGISSA